MVTGVARAVAQQGAKSVYFITTYSGCRHRAYGGRQQVRARQRERPDDPAWSETLACADAPCAGTGRSRDRPFGNSRRSASGRRGAVADDVRSREVRPRHSSWEADEQGGFGHRGAGGAKGGGRGECEPAKHASDTVPKMRVIGAGAHTASSPSLTQGGSRMRESRTYGSVRGVRGNSHPYRDGCFAAPAHGGGWHWADEPRCSFHGESWRVSGPPRTS